MADDRRRTMGEGQAVDPAGWVDRHGDGLYRYAMLRLGDPDRAADVVQETFLHALRSSGSFSGRSSERTWLVGILKHKVADHRRAAARRESLADTLAAAAAGTAGGVADPEFDRSGRWRVGPSRWAGAAGRDVEAREFWDVVGTCLAKLPPTLADAFLLRELDGLEPDEVRRRLGITPANLWARLHRARSLLRACLQAGWFDPAGGSPPRAAAPPLPPAPKGPAAR